MTDSDTTPLSQREYLSPAQLAAYAGISIDSAYRLAWSLGARRRRHVGLRVRRALVDEHLTKPDPAPAAATRAPRKAGAPVACQTSDDDEEVLPGITRGMLKEQAGF